MSTQKYVGIPGELGRISAAHGRHILYMQRLLQCGVQEVQDDACLSPESDLELMLSKNQTIFSDDYFRCLVD